MPDLTPIEIGLGEISAEISQFESRQSSARLLNLPTYITPVKNDFMIRQPVSFNPLFCIKFRISLAVIWLRGSLTKIPPSSFSTRTKASIVPSRISDSTSCKAKWMNMTSRHRWRVRNTSRRLGSTKVIVLIFAALP